MAEPRRRPGGQGINVARAVRVLGGEAVAVALLGGETGRAAETGCDVLVPNRHEAERLLGQSDALLEFACYQELHAGVAVKQLG